MTADYQASPPRDIEEAVQSLMPTAAQRTSGNASFDAYRSDMLERLEAEQHRFEGFLESRAQTGGDRADTSERRESSE